MPTSSTQRLADQLDAAATKAPEPSSSPGAAQFYGATLTPWQEGRAEKYTNAATQVAKYRGWVYGFAGGNAVAVASTPLRLYVAKPSRGRVRGLKTARVPRGRLAMLKAHPRLGKAVEGASEVEEVLEHPILDLLEQVNPHMNQFEFIELTDIYLELSGNAYWLVIPNPLGVPVELWPLPSQDVTPIVSRTTGISHYEVGRWQDKKKIPRDRIIHFKFPNPKAVSVGMGCVEAAMSGINLDEAMTTFETATLEHGGVPPVVVMLEDEQQDDAIKKMRRQWRQLYGGASQAGKVAFLSGGVDIKPLALSPKEMSFLRGREWTRDELGFIFGWPKSMITSNNVNLANANAGKAQYAERTIRPRCMRIDQKLTERLVPFFEVRTQGAYMFLAFDDCVPDDLEYKLKQQESHLKTLYASINEERELDGLPPVPWGDVPIAPMNMQPLGTPLPEPAPPPGAPPEEQDDEQDEEPVNEGMATAQTRATRPARPEVRVDADFPGRVTQGFP